MRLKPKRFIAHKIGPFEHLELNWETDSRYTLIVAENGMGKTSLVTAMAACLSLGDDNLFHPSHLQRFAHDETAFAAFEFVLNDASTPVVYAPTPIPDETLDRLLQQYHIVNAIGPRIDGTGNIGDARRKRQIRCILHPLLREFQSKWQTRQNITVLAAAYSIRREVEKPDVQEQREIKSNPLHNILNPFATIQSSEIFQWVINQHVNYALALAEGKDEEAKAYLTAIRRVEQLLTEALEFPLTFQIQRNPFSLVVKQNGHILAIEQLSDGTRSLLGWSLDYLMRASRLNWENPMDSTLVPGLVLVDEIDSHLHPEWQRRILPAVSQLLPETYIIATTHSPFVVNSADDAQLFQIYRGMDGQLQVKSSYDDLYGQPADLVLQKAFVPSLYPPEIETKLKQLSQLAQKVMAKTATPQEKKAHQTLLRELAQINPWLENLLNLTQGVHLPS